MKRNMQYITKTDFEKVEKQNGIVVLDDNSTYSGGLDDIHVIYLTEEGIEELDDGVEPNHLAEDMGVMSLNVQSLIDFWNDNNPV